MNASEAGRKGGQSRSPRKLAAARRNGFQPVQRIDLDLRQMVADGILLGLADRYLEQWQEQIAKAGEPFVREALDILDREKAANADAA